MFASSNPRSVTIPEGQISERSDLPPLTITSFAELKMFGLTFVDANGRERPMLVVLCSDGSLHSAPDGEQWIGRLRPLSTKMAESFNKVYRDLTNTSGINGPTNVPDKDNVDIIA